MGEAKRRGSIQERTQQAIERNKREAEEREEKRQQHLAAEREARRLQWDKEDAVIQYLTENVLSMESDKLYILDVAGEEVTIQQKPIPYQYIVNFGKGREVIEYEVVKEEDLSISVNEILNSRLSFKNDKKQRDMRTMLGMMAGMTSSMNPSLMGAYERGIYGR